LRAMCNLYNVTTNRQAVVAFTKALRDNGGWNQPSLNVYPNTRAPVVRNAPDGVRELSMLTWGMPTTPDRVKGKVDRGTTNIRRPHRAASFSIIASTPSARRGALTDTGRAGRSRCAISAMITAKMANCS